jgi:hypothetical protein
MFMKLRQRMGRLGVVMTFLAILFTAAPILEAAACAAEGCGIACMNDAAQSKASETSDPGAPEGCTDQGCVCAVGHCHAGSIPAPIQATYAPIAIDRSSPIVSEPVVSALPSLLERPPRA